MILKTGNVSLTCKGRLIRTYLISKLLAMKYNHILSFHMESHKCFTVLTFDLHNTHYQVCREWEGKAFKVNKDVRLVLIRIGVVLGKDGGALGIIFVIWTLFCKEWLCSPLLSFFVHLTNLLHLNNFIQGIHLVRLVHGL